MKEKIIEITEKRFYAALHYYMHWENEDERQKFLSDFADEIKQLLTTEDKSVVEPQSKLGAEEFLESIGIDIRVIKATRIPITLKEYEGEISIIELMKQYTSQQ